MVDTRPNPVGRLVRKLWGPVGFAVLGVTAIIAVVAVIVTTQPWNNNSEDTEQASADTPVVDTVDDSEEEDCTTWESADVDHTGNRWFADGVTSIAEATTPDEARAAAHEWLDMVRVNEVTLVGASNYLLTDREVRRNRLFDDEGCATPYAVELVTEMEMALSLSSIRPDEAPTDGFNSGVADGVVGTSAHAGVSGDRRAVLIELPDGSQVWIMARCGNPVVKVPPPHLPKVPTDEPPPPPPTQPPPTQPPPTQPPEPKCFDAAGNPVFDGRFCGTPSSGPEQQPVQEHVAPPTPGYVPGRAEENNRQQEEAANNRPYTPSPNGQPAPSPEGTPGQTDTPSGPVNGGNQGVTNPDSSPGHQNQPVNEANESDLGGPP